MPKKINKINSENTKTITATPQIRQAINWDIIVRSLKTPHITEKATTKEEQSQYVFKVPVNANKIMIKQALHQLYGKKVIKVGIINIKRKKRQKGRRMGFKSGYKKAIISLKKGEKLTLFPKK